MLPALVLLALVLWTALTPSFGRPSAVLLALLAVLWVAVNGPMEGPVLLGLTATHGVTAADMAALAAFVVAGVCWWKASVRARHDRAGSGSSA